jgi:hypothetical protein
MSSDSQNGSEWKELGPVTDNYAFGTAIYSKVSCCALSLQTLHYHQYIHEYTFVVL